MDEVRSAIEKIQRELRMSEQGTARPYSTRDYSVYQDRSELEKKIEAYENRHMPFRKLHVAISIEAIGTEGNIAKDFHSRSDPEHAPYY